MKKTIILSLLGLAFIPASMAGETPEIATAPVLITPRYEAQPFSVSVKAGMMHTDVGTYGSEKDLLQNVPSLLYGGTIGASKDLMEKWGLVHTIGISAGVFTGYETSSWSYDAANTSSYQERFEVDVWAIPLTVSYNIRKDISDSLSIYCGIRTGAMIRNTSANGYTKDTSDEVLEYNWKDSSSTRIMPMLGAGVGIQMYTSDKWCIDLSYDFVWTFGNDCSRLSATSGSEGYANWAPKETSMSHRYYGTIGFGITRFF